MPNQQVLRHLMRGRVDDGDAVRGPQRNKAGLAVRGELDADRLDGLAPQTENFKSDLFGYLVLDGIDDADATADLGRDPKLRPIRLELGIAGPCINQHVRDDLAR